MADSANLLPESVLQDIVSVLKTEVEHSAKQVRRLQRENRILVRTVTSLQHERHMQHQHERTTSNLSPRRAPPLLRCNGESPLCMDSPKSHALSSLQSDPLGDPFSSASSSAPLSQPPPHTMEEKNPTPLGENEMGPRYRHQNEALRTRVAMLEKQLARERLRRRAEEREYICELELLRLALDEAERRQHAQQPPQHPFASGAVFAEETLFGFPAPVSARAEGGGGESHALLSNPSNAENLSASAPEMDLPALHPRSASDPAMFERQLALEMAAQRAPVELERDTTSREAYLSQMATRMRERRERMRNAVLDTPPVPPLPEEAANGAKSHALAHTSFTWTASPPTSPTHAPRERKSGIARRGWTRGTGAGSAVLSANSNITGVPQMSHLYETHRHHAQQQRPVTSAASNTAATNPNQLGVEVNPRGPLNRTWYIHQVLRKALARSIQSLAETPQGVGATPGAESTAAAALFSSSSASSLELEGAYSETDGDGAVSPTHSAEGRHGHASPTPPSAQVGGACGSSLVHTEEPSVGALAAARGVYKSTTNAAVQRAIEEVSHMCFHCAQNEVVMTSGSSIPRKLPYFHEENNNLDLLQAFAMDSTVRDHRSDAVRVTVHAPVLFSQVRSFLHMDVESFHASLTPESVWRQALSPGKSGTALIYFGNFVMKSIKESEFTFLRNRFLSSYAPFCERNPHTMLPRFYALLSFTWLQLRTSKRYVLMQNVFSTPYYIHRIYDVKGSTVGRSTAIDKAPRTSFGALLLKDNDLTSQLIICGPIKRANLLAQFRSDTNFLCSLDIVDYSCLIGLRSRVVSRKEGPTKTIVLKERCGDKWQLRSHSTAIGVGEETAELDMKDNSCIHGCDGGLLSLPIYTPGDDTTAREDVYYLGIIDVLQVYTPAKRLENFAKGLWNDRRQISVIPPKEFAERLYKAVDDITL